VRETRSSLRDSNLWSTSHSVARPVKGRLTEKTYGIAKAIP
jgi:hypothetical protein